jgi:hypothetical protein
MSSPKEKTRRTYTRRAPKTKIMDTLQELKDLIERHCGESQAAIQQTARAAASEAVAAALGSTGLTAASPESPLAYAAPPPSALPPPMMPSAARVLVPNPVGPSEWNQFMAEFKAKYEAEARARGNDRKKIPYMEVLKAGKEAYQARKVSEGRTTRRRAPARAPVNINAIVAPLTQRMNAANEQRRQLAAKIEVYKTAMPRESEQLRGMMNKATQSRADLDAAIAALRGKKLSAAATKKAEALIQDTARNFNAQTVRIDEATRRLNSEFETMRAKKAARRVSTLNNRGMTPRNEQYFNAQTPLEEEEGSTASSNTSSTGSSSSSNNSSTGSSSSSNNSSTGSSSSSNNSSNRSSGSSSSTASRPSPSPEKVRTPSPVAQLARNAFSNFTYNNSGPDEDGVRKVSIKGKKYYLLPDNELVERGDNSDPNALGPNIVGVWKNGSIQPYVPSEEGY